MRRVSPRRISVIGISGSGKSFLARTLAERMDLPVFHMDTLFWKGKWQEVPEAEYLSEHRDLISRDRWIIEGYIDEHMADRLKRADLVIFLDYAGWRCAWRVVRRWWAHRHTSRPELPAEAKEELRYAFLKKVFWREERVPIMDAFQLVSPRSLVQARSPRELKRHLSPFVSL